MKSDDEDLRALLEALAAGDCARALDVTDTVIAVGVGAERILRDALLPSLEKAVGAFGRGSLFLSELLLAIDAVQTCADRLQPHLADATRAGAARGAGVGAGEAANIAALLVRVGETASGGSEVQRFRVENDARPRPRGRAGVLAGMVMRWFDSGHTTAEITRMLVPRLIASELPA